MKSRDRSLTQVLGEYWLFHIITNKKIGMHKQINVDELLVYFSVNI